MEPRVVFEHKPAGVFRKEFKTSKYWWYRSNRLTQIRAKQKGNLIILSARRLLVRILLRISMREAPWILAFARLLGAAAPEARWATCPECGNPRVKRLAKLDCIDRISETAWSALQQHLGGGLYRCTPCRLQFYDCRKARFLVLRRLQFPHPFLASHDSVDHL